MLCECSIMYTQICITLCNAFRTSLFFDVSGSKFQIHSCGVHVVWLTIIYHFLSSQFFSYCYFLLRLLVLNVIHNPITFCVKYKSPFFRNSFVPLLLPCVSLRSPLIVAPLSFHYCIPFWPSVYSSDTEMGIYSS